MSIPKEPRQLMINLMYLVLTAMLALNVSAEILSAFMSMDKSISESNEKVSRSNFKLLDNIKSQAEAYQQYEHLNEKAMKARRFTDAFMGYVDQLKEKVIEAGGGFNEKGEIKNIKNKDATTRVLVKNGEGEALRIQILATRDSLLQLIDSTQLRDFLATSIPLKANAIPANSKKKSWAKHHFEQMPIAAVLPLLSKMQNDARTTEATILNEFVKVLSLEDKLDSYNAIVSADRSYVVRGEALNAEIFLGAYSSTTDNIEMFANGRKLEVRDGKALLNLRPEQIGKQKVEVMIREKDPLTEEIKEYRRTFGYEVGERSVTVSADKMNVFYVGVDNPLSISVAGVPSDQVQVRGEGVNPVKLASGQYNVKPTRPGLAKVIVSGGGLEPTSFNYRIKPIPTPVIKIGNKSGGSLTVGEMRVYDKLSPVLEQFDFEARCTIKGFVMVRVPKTDSPRESNNPGGRFNANTKRIAEQAKRGDLFYFDNIKVKCPGDRHNRSVPSLTFKIR